MRCAIHITGAKARGLGPFKVVGHIALIRRIMRVSKLSLIVDADHGYGNALNVQRTVRAYGRAGAAAILIEDKITPRALMEGMAEGGAVSARVFQAMMGMGKIDVAAIEAARRG